MNRIEIRGTIVPSEYDNDWLNEYIDKGLITPESRFRNAVMDSDPAEDITVYINSPGGSVFAAYEMMNAVTEWKIMTGKQVNVVIGAMAASAASAFAVMVGDKISVHQNAKSMFHGATTVTWAGQQSHEDVADLLGKINNDIKVALVDRTTLAMDDVDEWFDEAREGWLTADEMMAVGLADEIIGADTNMIELPEEAKANMAKAGLDIAAMYEMPVDEVEDPEEIDQIQEEEADGCDDESNSAESTDGDAEEISDADVEDELVEEEPETLYVDDAAVAYDEGMIAGEARIASVKDAVIGQLQDRIEDSDKQIVDLEETIAKMTEEHDQTIKDTIDKHSEALAVLSVEHMQEVEALQSKLSKLTGGMAATPMDDVHSWREALSKCGGDYIAARKQYPAVYAQQREMDRINRNK